jgi:hypothetical protein
MKSHDGVSIKRLLVGFVILSVLILTFSKPTKFDHDEYIRVCKETGGTPRLVEADVDGLVVNCWYPETIPDAEY